MSYQALYRKWRPQVFADVKGQDHIVKTLQNQIGSGRIGHAYLFCGTRGTGKTTVAKILARAVNCEHPVDGSPCGECPSCRQIAAGTSLNVVEIDAASNIVFRIPDRVREPFHLFLRHVDDVECQTLGRLISDSRKFRQLLYQF